MNRLAPVPSQNFEFFFYKPSLEQRMLNFEQIQGQTVFLSQTRDNCRAKTVNSF